ncbi:MAG: BlaI/MecI/CopY family transcriptional regulator [Ilumatobacteraceae bacterium]
MRCTTKKSAVSRRRDGALEAEVLSALQQLGRPATPAEVLEQLDANLAYTSVATVLGRLCDKGVAAREKDGRAFRYRATATEADLTARRIRTILDGATDRNLALAGFVQSLGPDDAARLAELLDRS